MVGELDDVRLGRLPPTRTGTGVGPCLAASAPHELVRFAGRSRAGACALRASVQILCAAAPLQKLEVSELQVAGPATASPVFFDPFSPRSHHHHHLNLLPGVRRRPSAPVPSEFSEEGRARREERSDDLGSRKTTIANG